MYHSKTLGGIFREKKQQTQAEMVGQVLDVKKNSDIKCPLGSVMCSGRKFAGKEDINMG